MQYEMEKYLLCVMDFQDGSLFVGFSLTVKLEGKWQEACAKLAKSVSKYLGCRGQILRQTVIRRCAERGEKINAYNCSITAFQ